MHLAIVSGIVTEDAQVVVRVRRGSADRDFRDFKIQRRGRQRERRKNNRFNKQNNKLARASNFFVLFFPVFARLRHENA